MFSLTVVDHIMIAHSFPSPTFGPALRNRLAVQATPYTKVTAL